MPSLANITDLLVRLGGYIRSDDAGWQQAKAEAGLHNGWFTPEYIDLSAQHIAASFLEPGKLAAWRSQYASPASVKDVGIVCAGNIPLVGFHDILCGLMSGHRIHLKLSSKDYKLPAHLIGLLQSWEPLLGERIFIREQLRDCDAYIATGSNNSSRYFEQYFARFPHIIRKNRTSVAVLDGSETEAELDLLADDIFSYFGLGCRNVTQVCLPEGYDPAQLLACTQRYSSVSNHHKYKNNYDYYLAIYLLNRIPYISNEQLLLIENSTPFSPISVLHYRFYKDREELLRTLSESEEIQCVVSRGEVPFGTGQNPGLSDYPDGVDTMRFLTGL